MFRSCGKSGERTRRSGCRTGQSSYKPDDRVIRCRMYRYADDYAGGKKKRVRHFSPGCRKKTAGAITAAGFKYPCKHGKITLYHILVFPPTVVVPVNGQDASSSAPLLFYRRGKCPDLCTHPIPIGTAGHYHKPPALYKRIWRAVP